MKNYGWIGVCAAIIVAAAVLGSAYTYKYRSQDTVVVTGLGETEFTSDLIVWRGYITAESPNVESGYAQLESSKKKVSDFLVSKGIEPPGRGFSVRECEQDLRERLRPQRQLGGTAFHRLRA